MPLQAADPARGVGPVLKSDECQVARARVKRPNFDFGGPEGELNYAIICLNAARRCSLPNPASITNGAKEQAHGWVRAVGSILTVEKRFFTIEGVVEAGSRRSRVETLRCSW